jgi:cobalamin biosynthesis protein CobD/CbiB
MPGIVFAAIRTAVQSWWGIAVGWLASHGITVSEEQSAIVHGLLVTVCIGLSTAGLRWMETRQGDGWQAVARRVASVLMLGMSGQQPTYPRPSGE